MMETIWLYMHIEDPTVKFPPSSAVTNVLKAIGGVFYIWMFIYLIRGCVMMCANWTVRQVRYKTFFIFMMFFMFM
jgi:hypothetical protein